MIIPEKTILFFFSVSIQDEGLIVYDESLIIQTPESSLVVLLPDNFAIDDIYTMESLYSPLAG